MKKLLIALLALMFMAGCSNTNDPADTTVTKTCTFEQEGMTMSMTATAPSEDANVETMTIGVVAPYDAMGIDASSLNDELKETMATLIEQSVAQQFGEDTDYIEVTKSEFTDTAMELELAMDVTAMTEANGGTSEDLTIASFVTEMENSGMSCN